MWSKTYAKTYCKVLKANVLAIRGVSFDWHENFVYTRDPFRPITFEQGEGEAREGYLACRVRLLLQVSIFTQQLWPSPAKNGVLATFTATYIPVAVKRLPTQVERRVAWRVLYFAWPWKTSCKSLLLGCQSTHRFQTEAQLPATWISMIWVSLM